jgi:hypothetical protein
VVYVLYSAVVVAAAMRFEPSGYEKGRRVFIEALY